jgi:hypothetical protein
VLIAKALEGSTAHIKELIERLERLRCSKGSGATGDIA